MSRPHNFRLHVKRGASKRTVLAEAQRVKHRADRVQKKSIIAAQKTGAEYLFIKSPMLRDVCVKTATFCNK